MGVTTPPLTTLFNADWYDFDGSTSLADGGSDETISYDIAVENTGTATVSYSSGMSITFQRNYTPLIQDVVPNQVYYGMPVDFMVNQMGCNDEVPDDQDPMKYIKIDETILNWEGIIDSETRINSYDIDRLSAIVTDQLPNA